MCTGWYRSNRAQNVPLHCSSCCYTHSPIYKNGCSVNCISEIIVILCFGVYQIEVATLDRVSIQTNEHGNKHEQAS